jgi:hypothetical protein
MQRGTLVVTRNKWSLRSLSVGIAIDKIDNPDADNVWVVMWSGKEIPSFQEHVEDSLLEVTDENTQEIGQRRCIST